MNAEREASRKKMLTRRQLLKASGAASAVLGSAGLGAFGYQAGRSPATYTGCEALEGAAQTFNRAMCEVDSPHYEVVGPTSRPDPREFVSARRGRLKSQWDEEKGLDGLDEQLQQYYAEHPEDLELDLLDINELRPTQATEAKKYSSKFKLTMAWSSAVRAVTPPRINDPPEVSDFRGGADVDKRPERAKMKSPAKTSKLIKKIAFQMGSTLVGIAKLNPDWVYLTIRGVSGQAAEVPKHWQYAVVVGTPMAWDATYANPNYGTSYDGYAKTSIAAYRLASFIRELGYAARPHTPLGGYDLMVPPIVVDAGLGEQGRHSIVITPELGCNFRPAVVTTDLPLEPDKPIDMGVQGFCENCKICAENCPNGAITQGEKVEVRGYRRYAVDTAKCQNFWHSNLGNLGCRLCVAVCPFTRKGNWLHRTALQASVHDPTGIVDEALIGLQERFYPGPDPETYFMPALGGKNASYREPPWWLRSEDFIEAEDNQGAKA